MDFNKSIVSQVTVVALPNDELHLAPASGVHKDRNQLWVPRAKDAMRPDGNCEETLLLVTSLEDQLKHKGSLMYSTLDTAKQRMLQKCAPIICSLLSRSSLTVKGTGQMTCK